MSKVSNKTEAVLAYLKKNPKKGITSLEAFHLCGATRLSAIIFNLRKKYHIDSIWMEAEDQFGNTCRFTKYVLKDI